MLHAGTIGIVTDIAVIVSAAELLSEDHNIRFVIVGDGHEAPAFKDSVAKRDVQNVLFAPFQPRSRLSDVQGIADVGLLVVKTGQEVTSVPSRVLGYMSAARPILAAVSKNSESARFIERAKCGVIVEPSNPQALAMGVRMFKEDSRKRAELGSNGRQFLLENLSKDRVIGEYRRLFSIVGEP